MADKSTVNATRIRYGLVALLVAFEAAVAILALRPQVSDQFRAYFIDRSTDCWPLAVSGRYKLGETVSFLAHPASPATGGLKVCGWTDAEDTGTWSVGPEARLRFRVPYPVADLLLEMDMLAFIAAGLPEQGVILSVNGAPLDVLRLGPVSTGKKYFRIPQALVRDHWGYLDLTLQLPNARSPTALGLHSDRRRLAVRLLSVRLSLARGVDPPT